jgi:CDP-2,3-bis-(O-geranylgeranyl)-sn-glycerol synthase
LLGFGALAGDSIKSFFKRRVGVKPGKRWFPFDQIDFVIGALAFASIVYFPGWKNALIILLISLAGHVLVNHSAYYLKIRGEKW